MATKFEPIAWNFCPICGTTLERKLEENRLRPFCAPCDRHFYANPTPASCCFVTQGDALLLGQRGVEPMRGEWALPGGYVELEETTEETARRELFEETGLTALKTRLLGISSQQSPLTGAVLVIGYIIEEWEGELKAGSDVLDLRFVAPADMPRLPFRAHRELHAIYQALRAGEGPLPVTSQTQPVPVFPDTSKKQG